MGKYGKKHVISEDPLDYNIGIIGEGGIGKSTLLKETFEKLVGDSGYIMLDVGKEDGHKAIDGIVSEEVPDWNTFVSIVDDIVDNKNEEYPDLKIVGIDTYDQLIDIAIPEVIRMHNAQYKPPVDIVSIKQAFSGWGGGEDKVIQIVLEQLWRLKQAGVSFAIIGHTKLRDKDDAVTGESYSTLTSDLSAKYFNAIKNKLDILGVASVDREIVKEKTGKKDFVTKKDIIKGRVTSESRILTFRDDNYTIDSKARFSEIVDCIPLNADAFIQALKDAIAKQKGKVSETEEKLINLVNGITTIAKELFADGFDKEDFYAIVTKICNTRMFNKVKDVKQLEELLAEVQKLEVK